MIDAPLSQIQDLLDTELNAALTAQRRHPSLGGCAASSDELEIKGKSRKGVKMAGDGREVALSTS